MPRPKSTKRMKIILSDTLRQISDLIEEAIDRINNDKNDLGMQQLADAHAEAGGIHQNVASLHGVLCEYDDVPVAEDDDDEEDEE